MNLHIKITDPEDPRIKKGAKFQWESETVESYPEGKFTTTITTKRVMIEPFTIGVDFVTVPAVRSTAWARTNGKIMNLDLYLIEEAPDTDKEFRDALIRAMKYMHNTLWFHESEAQDVIDHLRTNKAHFNG